MLLFCTDIPKYYYKNSKTCVFIQKKKVHHTQKEWGLRNYINLKILNLRQFRDFPRPLHILNMSAISVLKVFKVVHFSVNSCPLIVPQIRSTTTSDWPTTTTFTSTLRYTLSTSRPSRQTSHWRMRSCLPRRSTRGRTPLSTLTNCSCRNQTWCCLRGKEISTDMRWVSEWVSELASN